MSKKSLIREKDNTNINFGKVSAGQEVKIKLCGFPYLEFWILRGTVAAIAPVPENTQEGLVYTVDVVLPGGLLSTYHKEIGNLEGCTAAVNGIKLSLSA